MSDSGTLQVVGVGPGDPDLMTLKAVNILKSIAVVAYPQTTTGSFAARIAAPHIRAAEHLPFTVPMSGDGAAEAAYDRAAAAIAEHLSRGRDVALLCEGDPMLYGSAASVMARLSHVPTRIVPGVIAASACAAAANRSLARGNTPVTILPATASDAALRSAMESDHSLVIYKMGRQTGRVAALARRTGRDGPLVRRATTADETITPLSAVEAGDAPYFSTALLPPPPRPAPACAAELAVVCLGEAPLSETAANALRAAGHTLDVIAQPAEPLHKLATLFRAGTGLIVFASTGIIIRALAPCLGAKGGEPPVVAVGPTGTVVPLLGTHRGGAAIAKTLCAAFGTVPAFTTRAEASGTLPPHEAPPGFVVANPKPFMAAAPGAIRTTIAPPTGAAETPTYLAKRVVLGMGCERGADPAAAMALARQTLADAAVDPRAVALVASLDLKADEPAFHAVADDLGAPFRVFSGAALAAVEAGLANPSEVVRAAVGVAGVAEGAALAAAGPGATLIAQKRVADGVTAALALAETAIAAPGGRAQGHLAIVGTGPGDPATRTFALRQTLSAADEFVGYGLYLDLVEDLRGGRMRHEFPLGAEEERTRFALERAGEGRSVALVSSGDPGIYAMASLAAELLERGDLSSGAQRVALTVVPGVSAAQAAAARLGAPLGHDFAFISLSDLLTPWPVIEARLRAAASADFAVALYNPRSRRRRDQLPEALSIFRAARGGDTPVMIAADIGRPAERVSVKTLRTVDPAAVDMLSTVLIGASTTRAFVRGDGRTMVYTPRGYGVGGSS
ncbi:MAG: precorrin-3B C(17)-methyltransferase [Pseudomonadota bacterium]